MQPQRNAFLMFLGAIALGGAIACVRAGSLVPVRELIDESTVEAKVGIALHWLVVGGIAAGGLYLVWCVLRSIFGDRR